MLFGKADWHKLWDFVSKRTAPLFWVPTHTVTSLPAPRFRVLFATLLSALPGLFPALAARPAAAPRESGGTA